MKKTFKNKMIWLIISIAVSVSIPCSLLLIVFGFSKEDLLWLGFIGMILMMHGFYGVTFYWIKFARVSKYHRIVRMIDKLNYRNAREIAETLHYGRDFVNKTIRLAIEREWITGYKFNGLTLVPLNSEENEANKQLTCAYCGAKFTNEKEVISCPFCGAKIK